MDVNIYIYIFVSVLKNYVDKKNKSFTKVRINIRFSNYFIFNHYNCHSYEFDGRGHFIKLKCFTNNR